MNGHMLARKIMRRGYYVRSYYRLRLYKVSVFEYAISVKSWESNASASII